MEKVIEIENLTVNLKLLTIYQFMSKKAKFLAY